MKISGNRNTQQASQSTNDAKKTEDTKKKSAPAQKSMSEVAEGLTKSMNGRIQQLMKPAKTEVNPDAKLDDVKHDQNRARVQDGQLPTAAQPEAHAGLQQTGRIQMPGGPASGYQVDESLVDRGPAGGDLEFSGPGKFSDGRGGDADVGTMETGIGNPHAGMDRGAAGKLPPHRQAVIDAYKAKVFEAAANGDVEGANRWAGAVSEELGKGPGTDGSQPPGAETPGTEGAGAGTEGAEEKGWAEALTDKIKEGLANTVSGKNAEGGKTATQQMAEQADAELDANAGTKGKGLGEKARSEQAPEAAEESGGTNVDSSTAISNAVKKKDAEGVAEDRDPDSEEGPEVARELADQYQAIKMAAIANSEINPGDNVQGAAGSYAHVDSETYTGNYGEGGVHTPTEEEIAAAGKRAKDAGSIAPEAQ